MEESDLTAAGMRHARWERTLFVFFALLTIAPFWVVAWLPTTDGPSHLYNAFVQLHLDDPAYPQLRTVFEIDPRPLPNWIGQALLVGLLHAFAPATAEKVLASGYALIFLAAARFLAGVIDPRRRWLSWLAVPFVINWAFHFGFYSFCYSLAFYLFAVGIWWRWRERPGLALAAMLTPLLVLCYFAHLVAVVLALFSIGVLWLAMLGGVRRSGTLRRHLLHLPILLPHAVLPLWFLMVQRSEDRPPAVPGFAQHWQGFWQLGALFSYGGILPGQLLSVAFLGLLLYTVNRRLIPTERGLRPRWRQEDAFLFLAGCLTLLYFVSPDGMAGGGLLKPRLTLYPFLVLLPWLEPPSSRWTRPGLVAVLALFSAWNLWTVTEAYRSLDREAAEVLAVTDGIAPGSRVLPMIVNSHSEIPGPVKLSHVLARVSLAKGLVDWGDYEAASGHFPMRFARSVRRPPMWEIIDTPAKVDVVTWAPVIDYVYCWRVLPGSGAARRLETHFRLVAQHGAARLYERRDRLTGTP